MTQERDEGEAMSRPEVDATCNHRDHDDATPAYRLAARCLNCGTEMVVRLTFGHDRPSCVTCPACGSWRSPSWGELVS